MNEWVTMVLAILQALNPPDSNSPYARYYHHYYQAQTLHYVDSSFTEAMVQYDSAFDCAPGFRYHFLEAGQCALLDCNYRKFDDYVTQGTKVGLTLGYSKEVLLLKGESAWLKYQEATHNIRRGFEGFYKEGSNTLKLSYLKTQLNLDRIITRHHRMRWIGGNRGRSKRLNKFTQQVYTRHWPGIREVGDHYPPDLSNRKYEDFLYFYLVHPKIVMKNLDSLAYAMASSLEKGGMYPHTFPQWIDRFLAYNQQPQLFGTLAIGDLPEVPSQYDYYMYPVYDLAIAEQLRKKFYLAPLNQYMQLRGLSFQPDLRVKITPRKQKAK